MKGNYKILDQRPVVADRELAEFKNFKSILRQREHIVTAGSKNGWMRYVITSTVVVLITTGYYFYQDKGSLKVKPFVELDEREQGDILSAAAESEVRIPVPTTRDFNSTQSNTQTTPQIDNSQIAKMTTESDSNQPSEDNSQSDELQYVYLEATPVDGIPALYQYFATELKYPEEAISDSIQGVSVITFYINKDGKPEDIEVIQSLGVPFDEEAKRLIENMPPWTPASVNGKPIKSKLSIPISFEIKE